MGNFSFKSSGKTTEQQNVEQLTKSERPIGIKTPLRRDSVGGIFAMHYNLPDQIHDNLRNLLLTNWGERVGLYDFGANLRRLTAEFVSQDDFDSKAIEQIRNAVSRWMSFISLEDFLSVADRTENKNTGIIRITITYSIPALDIKHKALEVTLYVM